MTTQAEAEAQVRKYRDAFLAETDAWALSDRTMTEAQRTYRQALRDLPDHEDFPNGDIWPTKPE